MTANNGEIKSHQVGVGGARARIAKRPKKWL